ncbi:hypothetical protein BV25DRAFT_1769606, partial [Artomyces pyxidatus]
RHARFYLDARTITFFVEELTYCVHRYVFCRDSPHFAALLAEADESSPVTLKDVTCKEFDAFLSILYPSDFYTCDVHTSEDWASVLRLSTIWGFASIRKLAVERLETIASAVDKLVLGHAHDVNAWLLPGYVALCLRGIPLTLEEGRRLGMDDVILITSIRESIR